MGTHIIKLKLYKYSKSVHLLDKSLTSESLELKKLSKIKLRTWDIRYKKHERHENYINFYLRYRLLSVYALCVCVYIKSVIFPVITKGVKEMKNI